MLELACLVSLTKVVFLKILFVVLACLVHSYFFESRWNLQLNWFIFIASFFPQVLINFTCHNLFFLLHYVHLFLFLESIYRCLSELAFIDLNFWIEIDAFGVLFWRIVRLFVAFYVLLRYLLEKSFLHGKYALEMFSEARWC